jgi:hypothetical protein
LQKEEFRWERRYFWPGDTIIPLHGLDPCFRDLTLYSIKERQDTYYLLPDKRDNIKQRRGEILYKPLLQEKQFCLRFGKKILLQEQDPYQLEKIQAKTFLLKKTVLVYRFPTTPCIKLELCLLHVASCVYFSSCIEGKSQELVHTISTHLFKDTPSCDYVAFLQGLKTT